ncbi:hypothetical protein D7X33_27290, partial [Butyricicoccus sp. 1XD8-22]
MIPISNELKEYFSKNNQELPEIIFDYINETTIINIVSEKFESAFNNIDTIISNAIFRLSDGRYLFFNYGYPSGYSDNSPVVAIRDSS